MASDQEVQAAVRAYLDHEPDYEMTAIWGRTGSAMRAALEAAEQIRAEESNRAAPGVESPKLEGC